MTPAADLEIREALQALAQRAEDVGPGLTSDGMAFLLVAIRDGIRDLRAAYDAVERELFTLAGEKRFVVEGLGEVEIKGNVKRVKWDREDLLRVVLDSRLVNEATGEIEDETPIAKVLAVWNLPAPRVTALRARQIDPDEFCEATFEGWKVKLP